MSNKLNYENALKFTDTNYTDKGIELDKISEEYKSKVRNLYSIQNIYITGGGYVDYPISGGSPDSPFGWEEFVWRKTPARNSKFVFNTMDNIEVGKVARCELNIKYMEYDDFCVFRHIVNTERHFTVKFFDTDQKKWVCRDMYCSENSKGKFFTLKESIFGVIDMSIKLVGTNLDLEFDENGDVVTKTYTIKYNINGGSGSVAPSVSVTKGSQVELAGQGNINAPNGKALVGWQTKNTKGEVNGSYRINQSVTVWDNLELYAWYE